jgi:hypothetical protein
VNRQRGIIAQAYLYMAGALAILLAIAGAIYEWHSLTKSIDKAGYDRGVAETDAAYKARDNTQLQAVIAAQKAAEVKASAAEQKAAVAQSDALVAYSKGVTDGKSKVASFIASGGRLRDNQGTATGSCPTAGSGIGAASPITAATGNNGTTGCELSSAVSGSILALANEADAVVLQLTAAQARITSDYELCK